MRSVEDKQTVIRIMEDIPLLGRCNLATRLKGWVSALKWDLEGDN